MARRSSQSARIKARLKRFADSVENPLLGIGETMQPYSSTMYAPSYKTLNRTMLEFVYQSSWMCGLAVDIVAEDMTREGVDIKDKEPDVVDGLNSMFDDLGVWSGICDAIKWSRLYGGAIAVMLIDGDDMSKPLGRVRPGSFRGLYVFDRWQLDSTATEIVQTLGPDFGKPMYYRILADASEVQIPGQMVHYSRVIRFDGRRLPSYLRKVYNGWGASVLEPLLERIEMYDLASRGASQLISKSYLRFYKVEGLRDILTNSLARDGFLKQMEYIRTFQNFEGMTIGDKSDEFQTMTYTFTGIPEILLQIGQQISGALGIPLVRLFGQSPTGFNSTGESDLRIYYDNIKHDQDTDLRQPMKRLLRVMYQSMTGRDPDADFGFEFKSLWQMTNEQKAAAATGMAGTIIQALQSEAITPAVAMRELKKLSDTVGIFSSITDEDIDAADELESGMMPPTEEAEGYGIPGGSEEQEGRGMVPNPPKAGIEADRPDSEGIR